MISNPTTAIDQIFFAQLEGVLKDALDDDAPLVESADLLSGGQSIFETLGISYASEALQQRLQILRRAYPALQRYKDTLNIESSLLSETFAIYIPIAQFMAARAKQIRESEQRACIFGINGGQGSGKTTINAFLQIILKDGLGLRSTGFSIDDVYKTHAQRQTMAGQIHPLFAIRSVAGTHDTQLAIDTLQALSHSTSGQKIAIPQFDKMAKQGQGDRLPESAWPLLEGPLDVIIFEGWCVGAQPQPPEQLKSPVNQRESDEDPQGVWRSTMNQLLATDYRELFSLLDELMVIQIRSMEDVFHNRELQEQHLRRRLAEARVRGEDTGDQGAMSPEEVIAFISLYERTTRHMLATLPEQARLTLFIGDKHRIEKVRCNRPAH